MPLRIYDSFALLRLFQKEQGHLKVAKLLEADRDYVLTHPLQNSKGDRNLRIFSSTLQSTVCGRRQSHRYRSSWHPLRLAAMANKALQVLVVQHLLTADEIFFGDPPLFFKSSKLKLSHLITRKSFCAGTQQNLNCFR